MTRKAHLRLVTPEPARFAVSKASAPTPAGAIQHIVIRGITAAGKPFRPSDWAERLYYAVASYGPNRSVTFNPRVTLRVEQGVKCVAVDTRLRDEDGMLFDFLMGFARDNELTLLDHNGQPLTDIAW